MRARERIFFLHVFSSTLPGETFPLRFFFLKKVSACAFGSGEKVARQKFSLTSSAYVSPSPLSSRQCRESLECRLVL